MCWSLFGCLCCDLDTTIRNDIFIFASFTALFPLSFPFLSCLPVWWRSVWFLPFSSSLSLPSPCVWRGRRGGGGGAAKGGEPSFCKAKRSAPLASSSSTSTQMAGTSSSSSHLPLLASPQRLWPASPSCRQPSVYLRLLEKPSTASSSLWSPPPPPLLHPCSRSPSPCGSLSPRSPSPSSALRSYPQRTSLLPSSHAVGDHPADGPQQVNMVLVVCSC